MDRFWSKAKVLGPDECWLWKDGPTHGYGQFWYEGRTVSAHRVAYILTYGTIPEGAQIGHLCHDAHPTCSDGPTCPHRRCVNPSHLRAQTPSENQRGKRNRCRRGLHEWMVEGVDYMVHDGRWRCLRCRSERLEARRSSGDEAPRRKTVCKRGHDLLDPEIVRVNPDGSRTCRACRRERAWVAAEPMTASEAGLKGARARWGTP